MHDALMSTWSYYDDGDLDESPNQRRARLASAPPAPVSGCPKCGRPRTKGWAMHEKHCKGPVNVDADES